MTLKNNSIFLQVQMKEGEQEEVDTSGRCKVKYVVGDRNKIVKFKENCRSNTESTTYEHINKVSLISFFL